MSKITLDLKDEPELFEALNKYRKASGWTWKWLILIGMARSVEMQKEHPDLIVKLADYLEK